MLYGANGKPLVATPATPALVTPTGNPVSPAKPAAIPARISLYGKRIRMLVSACPKLPGSKAAARWALYSNGQTVASFIAAAKAAGHTHPATDVAYNVKHGFIALE
jgi:hypothetical protein